MNREDIIRMARESEWLSKYDSSTEFSAEVAIRFAELVAAHERAECAKFCAELRKMAISEERDECAKIADNNRHNLEMLTSLPLQSGAARCIAAAIRARGKQ